MREIRLFRLAEPVHSPTSVSSHPIPPLLSRSPTLLALCTLIHINQYDQMKSLYYAEPIYWPKRIRVGQPARVSCLGGTKR